MVKQLSLLLLVVLSVSGYAQPNSNANSKATYNPYQYFPKLGATATFSPGFMSGQRPVNYYLHGNAFVFIDQKVSLRGDAFISLRSDQADRLFVHHHTFTAGPSFHLFHGKVMDPYAGFTLGISYTGLSDDSLAQPSGASINPLVMPHLGCRFYAERWFYFYVETHYAIGKHYTELVPAVAFNEWRISAGLGFQFAKRKEKIVPGNK